MFRSITTSLALIALAAFGYSSGNCLAQVAQTNPSQQGTAGQGPSTEGRPYQTVPLQAPPGFPLSEGHQKFVDDVLHYWEVSSGQVERLKCSFNRWSYDSGVCNYVDPETQQMVAFEIAGGEFQFENPDKAYFSVERKRLAIPPSAANPKLDWRDLNTSEMDQQKERYVCSGDAIWVYDFAGKQLVKQILPPELQGEGIRNTPLPFLFGAKADELKQRYWIRPLQAPEGVTNQWFLEIYPKLKADAENYSVVRIVLSGEEFLPKSVQMFAPDYNPQKIQLADGSTLPAVIKYQVYEFQDHKLNFALAKLLAPWRDAFQPRTPLGWKMVEKQAPSSAPAQQTANAAGDPIR